MVNPMYEMDDLSAALAIQLLLDDSEELFRKSKGKRREGELSDAELALTFYQSDLEQTSRVIFDRRIARNVGAAEQADGNVLAGNDAGANPHLEERTTALCVISTPLSSETDSELLLAYSVGPLAESKTLEDSAYTNDSDDEGKKVISRGFGGPYQDSKMLRCAGCQEFVGYDKVVRAPCSHDYCEECLRDLFESSMTDESLFPPRCCKQVITVAAVRHFLTSDSVELYEQKKIEFESTNRTYCSSSGCSKFLPPKSIKGDQGTCQDCGVITCVMCKTVAHDGDCPVDTDLQLVLATATENGWQRCYSCHRLLELESGCNHMTCICCAEFCYVCGLQWKTCTCPQWDEIRLLREATQIFPRREPRAAADGNRDQQIAFEVQNVRGRHNCTHNNWAFVRGTQRCEVCAHTLQTFAFRCPQCHLTACRRCMRNRL